MAGAMATPPSPALGNRDSSVTTSGIGRPVTCSARAMNPGGKPPLLSAAARSGIHGLMEVVKVTRFDSGPVVNRHRSPPFQIIQCAISFFTPRGFGEPGYFIHSARHFAG